MKKRFTRIMAAFALLVFMAPSMVMWGQTTTTENVTLSNGSFSTDHITWTCANNGITIQQLKGTSSTAVNSSYISAPRVYKGHVLSFVGSETCKIKEIDITVSGTYYGNSMTAGTVFLNNTVTDNTTDVNRTWTSTSGGTHVVSSVSDEGLPAIYIQNVASTNVQLRFTALSITYVTSGAQPTTYTVTFDAGDGSFVGSNDFPNTSNTVIAGTYDLPSATPETGYIFDGWLATGSTTPVTGSYTVSGDVDFTASYSESTPPTGDLVIDFESATTVYTDWNFTNMTSQQTGSITAHGGTNYGTTGGKATASIMTNTVIATPGSLTCYVSKQSTNTTSSTWYIQVSSDGSTWNDVASRSATDMNKGEWKEFTADLSSYSNVYVRVYYSGSTAVRNIDDLTLTTSVSSVAAPVFTPANGTEFGNEGLSVTITCETSGTSIYYTLDGSTPDNNSTLYNGAITLTTTTTINAIAYDGTNYSNVATATYTYVDPNAPGTENNPYTVAQARAAIDAGTGTQGVYVTGIVSENNYYSQSNHYITYFISADGSTESDQLEAFHGKGINGADFTSADDIQVGDIVVIYGNLTKYNSTYELAEGNQLVSLERPNPTPIINAENVSIAYDATSGEIAYTITNPVDGQNLTATTTADWISNITIASDKVTFTTTTNEGDSNRTATITLSYNGATDKEITVTQGHYVAPFESATYTLATTIESGKTYIIVGEYEGDYYAMGEQKNNNRGAYTISVDGTTATVETADVHEVVITALTGDDAGKYTIEDGGYLYAASSSSNHLKTKSELDDDGKWTIVIENGVATITAQGDNTRNLMRFNPNNGTPIFACYATTSTTGSLPKLYVKNEPATESITLTVPGYGNNAGGYHLIASPIMENVLPTAVTNMIDATSANYDLYRFNQDADYEWQNYKHHTDGFVIEPGKAYLYAHNTDVTLTFNGTAYNGNGTFNLTQSATNTSNGGKMNALGNPFNATASIGNRSFYKMNADGTALEAVVGGTIGALEGIVVNYDANNPSVTFSTSKSRDVIELLTLNLQEQDNVIDNVIVRFDGGDQLLKYQIFDSSKIYVTVDGEDYAVVRGENQGTLPVNFVALSNGTYTISMDFENMTFSYLHLIDNLTGEDIDMLTTTSYSFDATTEDDANRFTLVYSKDGEGTTETLTFYDGDATSGYVPVYGFYADAYQKVEFIMPAEDLYALTGATINKMTWYLTTPAEDAWGGNFKIYLMETEATTPTDYANLTNATLVYDGPLDGTGETLEINFATSFFYEGNNLLVAVHQTEKGTYKSATFAGSAVTGAALQGYSYNNLDQVNQAVRDFLPKTTFEFTPGSGAIYYKPKQLQASEIGITSAVLTWEAGDDETSWGVEYKKVTEDTWTDAGTVDQLTITLDNLEAGTEYEAHVKSIYTDGESGWTTIAFATEACEETDKGEVAYTLTDTYGDGWTNNKLKIFLSGTDIMIAELTLTTGSELEGVVKLCYDTDYDLVWVAGSYAYETGFVLTAPDGTIIYEFHGTGNSGGTTPTPGVLTTFQIHNGFTKTIEAYTDNSGYYLIASPVGNVLASEVTNMVDGNYDLYMFDQTGDDEGKQWLNYKANAFSYLEVGLGYLYASESDVTLTFSGTPISSDDDYAVEVNYNASSDFPGLNLLGNPFAEEAYLVNAEGNGLAYHRLNPANNTYVTVDDNSAIPMMEGVFYEAGENDDVVYFSATAPATSKSNLNITVSQGRGMVDNAIVRFGEGNTLRKISLRDNSTKVYIPQNGSEYALVNANDCGEMPVNFKAESNGTYTMNFSNQNVEFGYLHLIDNLTGADVDLLANPSYSFEAKVSDYASRFKLVFATGNDDSSSDFAFVSNDEIIVNGEGMLQVIDMTGRIISTSQVNGMSSIKLNAAAGVYVLRLNDKTQKIVIR